VKIYSGKREVASTHARLVKDGTSYDHLSYTTGENGTKSLAQMSFAKEKCSLLLENESASSRTERAGK
jgi:hypothetical protein